METKIITEQELESIITRILLEDFTRKAFNVGLSVEEYKKSEAYQGLSKEDICKRVAQRIGNKWVLKEGCDEI